MEDIMKIVKSVEDSGLLIIIRVSEIIQNEAKEQKEGFLSIFYQAHQVLVYQEISQQVKESQEQDMVLEKKKEL